MTRPPAVDHLVVAARTLEEGEAWCLDTIGLAPVRGGKHPLMGTHNSLLPIGSTRHPACYLEILAIDAEAPPPGRARWFTLDEPALQQKLRAGPRLIHWVARVPDAAATLAAWAQRGIPAGPLVDAHRMTPSGLLHWRIAVRENGTLPFDGMLPTLIQWGEVHPADAMQPRAALQSLRVAHPDAVALRQALGDAHLDVEVSAGAPELTAVLQTPRGLVTLQSAAASAAG